MCSIRQTNVEINVAQGSLEVKRESSDLAEIKQILQLNMLESDKKINQLADQVSKLQILVHQNQQQPPPNFQPIYPPFYNQRHNNRNPIVCFSCGKPGHISRVCRSKNDKNLN